MVALADLLPSWLQLGGLLGVFFAGGVLWLGGRALVGGRGTTELHLFAGWGAFCLVLTVWGVATQASMRWPTLLFLPLAAIALAVPSLRPTREDAVGVLRVLVLALPIWAIMAAAEPALPDTFTNFLPNAVYLFDHGFFPADDRAHGFATWPAFPYNQPLATYLATLFLPQFPPGALVHLKGVMIFFTAGLPALGAAQAGIRVHGDFEGSKERSEHMVERPRTAVTRCGISGAEIGVVPGDMNRRGFVALPGSDR